MVYIKLELERFLELAKLTEGIVVSGEIDLDMKRRAIFMGHNCVHKRVLELSLIAKYDSPLSVDLIDLILFNQFMQSKVASARAMLALIYAIEATRHARF